MVPKRMWDSFQNQALNVEKLYFIVSRTLACARMPVYAYACMKHAHAGLEHACAYTCIHTDALGFCGISFLKIAYLISS